MAKDMPSHFGNKRMAKAFFEAVNYLEPPMPEKQKAEIYSKKFTIAEGTPFSRYERKQMSIFNPENPFPTEGSEGEDRVFAFIAKHTDKFGLAHGGKVDKRAWYHYLPWAPQTPEDRIKSLEAYQRLEEERKRRGQMEFKKHGGYAGECGNNSFSKKGMKRSF
jgi:hypothetical protein